MKAAGAPPPEKRSPQDLEILGAWWLRGLDLNQRPLGYEKASGFPACSRLFVRACLVSVLIPSACCSFLVFRVVLPDGVPDGIAALRRRIASTRAPLNTCRYKSCVSRVVLCPTWSAM